MEKKYLSIFFIGIIFFGFFRNDVFAAASLQHNSGLTYDYIPIENYSLATLHSTLAKLDFTAKTTSVPVPTIIPTQKIIPTEAPTPILTAIPTPIIDINSDAIWNDLAQCESGGNWNINTGNGYFGGLQFTQSAWESVGGTGNPAHASREEQIAKGKLLQQKRGWGAWGACAKKLGL